MIEHNSDATDYGMSGSNNPVIDRGLNIKYDATEEAKYTMKMTEDEEKHNNETEVKSQKKIKKDDIGNRKRYKSYSESSGIPFFFFSWMTNWIKYVGKGKLKHEDFPEIPDEDFDQEATARFGIYLEDYRDYDACNRLVKFVGRSRLCVLKVFRKNFILLYLFSIFNDIFEVFNIFLLKHVMKQKMPTTMVELFKYLALVLLVLTVNMIDIVTDGHHYFYYRRLVLRIENLLFSFLFSRILSKNHYSLTDIPNEGHQTIRRWDTDISITMLPRFHNSSNLLDSSNNIKLEEKKAKKYIESKKDVRNSIKEYSIKDDKGDSSNKDINNKDNDNKKEKENKEEDKEKVWVGDEEDISLLNLALFDISEISWGILKLVDLCTIPLKILIIGCWLYYQVGGTALKAIIFILISSTIMVLSECQSAKLVKGYVTRIDDRISKTLIILENLTNFKMFRWIDLCKQSVLVSRLMELQLCMKRAILSAIGSWLGISLPNILALAVFLIYSTNSKNGATLDPSFSIPLLHTLNHFIKPFRELPSDLSDHLETSISCNRIETFLFSKELSSYIVTSYSFKRRKKWRNKRACIKKNKDKDSKKSKKKETKNKIIGDREYENIHLGLDDNTYYNKEYNRKETEKSTQRGDSRDNNNQEGYEYSLVDDNYRDYNTEYSKIRYSNIKKTKLEVVKDEEGEDTVKTSSIYDDMGDTGRSTVLIETDNNIDEEESIKTTQREDIEIIGFEEYNKDRRDKMGGNIRNIKNIEKYEVYRGYNKKIIKDKIIEDIEYGIEEYNKEEDYKYEKIRKIEKYEEIEQEYNREIENMKGKYVIYMKGATFCRGDKKVINRMNFRLETKDKIVIVGSNIAEKFIFTMSLIDELHHTEGIYYNHYIKKDIKTGIVSQNPWIPMGTIREIIVFGNEFNRMLYDKVLDICQLKYDFSNWKLGDLRFVDEGGQNLSTGQKVRISLARSLYTLLIGNCVYNKEHRVDNDNNSTSNGDNGDKDINNNNSNKDDKNIKIEEIKVNKEVIGSIRNIKEIEEIYGIKLNNKVIKEKINKYNRNREEIGSMIILDEIFTVLDPMIGYTIFNNLFGDEGILNGFTCIITIQDSFLQILKGYKFNEKFKFYNLNSNNLKPIIIKETKEDDNSNNNKNKEEIITSIRNIEYEKIVENNMDNQINEERSNITNMETIRQETFIEEETDSIGDKEILTTRREIDEIDYNKITSIEKDYIDNNNNINTERIEEKMVIEEREQKIKLLEKVIKEVEKQKQVEVIKKEEKIIDIDNYNGEESIEQKLSRGRLFSNEKDENLMLVKLDNFVWYLKKVGLGLVGFVVSLSFVAMSLNVASDIVISRWTSVPSDTVSKLQEKMMIIRGIYNNNYFTKLNYLYVFTFITSCTIVLYLWRSLLEVHGTMNAAHKVYSSAMNGVLKCPIVTFNQIPIGNINNRLSADQSYIDYSVFRRFSHFVSSFIFTVLTAMSLCYLNPWAMLLIPILVLVSYFCVFKMYIPMSIFNMRSNLETRGYICSQFSQVISGAHVIKSLNNEEYIMESFLKYLRIHQRTKFFCHAASSWTMIRLRVLTYPLIVINLLIPLVPLMKSADFNSLANQEIASKKGGGIGLGNEDDGEMGATGDMVDGKLGLALTYSYKFAKLLKSSLNKVVELETEMCASQRLQELSKLDPDYNILDEKLFDGKKAKQKIKNFIIKRIKEINIKTTIGSEYNTDIDCNIVGERYFDIHYGLSVNKVVVRYDSKMCLNQITFNTGKNEHIGLIGRTGAGKSTLLMSLSGLIKLDSGNIVIDGIDISELSNEEMRKLVAILPHTPPLLPGWSIRRYVDPENEYSDEEIFEGIKNCRLIKLLSKLLENSKNNNNGEYNKDNRENNNSSIDDSRSSSYDCFNGIGSNELFYSYEERKIEINSKDYDKNNESRDNNNNKEEIITSIRNIEYEKMVNLIDIEEIEEEAERVWKLGGNEFEYIKEAMDIRITKQKENNYIIVSDIDLQYLTLLRLYLARKRLRLILIDECYTVEQGNIMELEPIYLMIDRLFKDNVIIIVAHQPESLSLCNRILLLEGGKIVETEFKN